MKENEPNPFGPIRFFEPARVGVEAEAAEGGMRVTNLHEGKPMAAAGLRVGDVILSVEGEKADSAESFRRHLRRASVQEQAVLSVRRIGPTRPSAVEHRPGVAQVGRLEALGEPAADPGQQRPPLLGPAPAAQHPGQAHRRPQLQRPRLLPPRHVEEADAGGWGFCPVGFCVPDWWDVHDGSVIPGSERWDADHEWPAGDFGFVWGCV